MSQELRVSATLKNAQGISGVDTTENKIAFGRVTRHKPAGQYDLHNNKKKDFWLLQLNLTLNKS